MDFNEIAEKAFRKEGLDEFWNLPVKYAYVQLEELYYRYSINDLSKEKCVKLKNTIRKEYESNLLNYNTTMEQYKVYNNNRIVNAMLLAQLEKTKDKDKIIELSLRIISNCIEDKSFVDRNLKKLEEIDNQK